MQSLETYQSQAQCFPGALCSRSLPCTSQSGRGGQASLEQTWNPPRDADSQAGSSSPQPSLEHLKAVTKVDPTLYPQQGHLPQLWLGMLYSINYLAGQTGERKEGKGTREKGRREGRLTFKRMDTLQE